MRTRTYGVPCPQDTAHGTLLDWPGERTAFHCPHRTHRGTAFYDSDLVPVTRPAAQPETAGDKAAPIRREAQPPIRSPEQSPVASGLPAATRVPPRVAATALDLGL